ncbi:MAG: ATP-binding protein [Rhodospirillaceae bacterium]
MAAGPSLRVTASYLLALGLIASLSVGTHYLVDTIVQKQEATAKMVNIAGRQRMLSQRIAGTSLELSRCTSSPERTRLGARLEEAVQLMETSHIALVHGSNAMGITGEMSAVAAAIYHEAPLRLDEQVTRYLAAARSFLALQAERQADSVELRDILKEADAPILLALDAAVRQYQSDSEDAIQRLRWLLLGTLALMLTTLVAEALLIFRPLFRRLAATNERLETVNRAYQEVLGFVAHELKNPVASMVTNARLLCDGYVGEITPQQRQKIERIAYNGQYLIAFVESYLDLAKIENAETSPSMLEITSLADEVVKPAIDLLHAQIEGRRMVLEVVIPDAQVSTRGNAELLRVVVVNLIGNAIKYGRELGRLCVVLEVEGEQAEISVWNEGPGFPPEKRVDLFQRFARQNTPELIRRKGTGLGLYTCWKIVQMHNGRIWADSELGAWARFAFRIPVGALAQASRAPNRSDAQSRRD